MGNGGSSARKQIKTEILVRGGSPCKADKFLAEAQSASDDGCIAAYKRSAGEYKLERRYMQSADCLKAVAQLQWHLEKNYLDAALTFVDAGKLYFKEEATSGSKQFSTAAGIFQELDKFDKVRKCYNELLTIAQQRVQDLTIVGKNETQENIDAIMEALVSIMSLMKKNGGMDFNDELRIAGVIYLLTVKQYRTALTWVEDMTRACSVDVDADAGVINAQITQLLLAQAVIAQCDGGNWKDYDGALAGGSSINGSFSKSVYCSCLGYLVKAVQLGDAKTFEDQKERLQALVTGAGAEEGKGLGHQVDQLKGMMQGMIARAEGGGGGRSSKGAVHRITGVLLQTLMANFVEKDGADGTAKPVVEGDEKSDILDDLA